MSFAHDPISDPLTTQWRARVDAAFAGASTRPCTTSAARLTDIQRETMALLATGFSVPEVAAWRGVHVSAVYHIRQIVRLRLTGHMR